MPTVWIHGGEIPPCPSCGVEVEHDGIAVEIQVRTTLQHVWAELFERLADLVGRQIRYGQPPNDPDVVIAGDLTAASLLQEVLVLGDTIADSETIHVELSALEDLLATLGPLRRLTIWRWTRRVKVMRSSAARHK